MDRSVPDDPELPVEGDGAAEQGSTDPEQVHPAHDAHGGSMAPGVVDDTGQVIGDEAGSAG
jgi:hypothetical protein